MKFENLIELEADLLLNRDAAPKIYIQGGISGFYLEGNKHRNVHLNLISIHIYCVKIQIPIIRVWFLTLTNI